MFELAGSAILYGASYYFMKLSRTYLDTNSVLVWKFCIFVISVGAFFLIVRKPVSINGPGVTFSLLSGLTALGGIYLFVEALKHNDLSISVQAIALAPLVSTILGVCFNHEVLTLRQLIAVGLFTIGGILFATP